MPRRARLKMSGLPLHLIQRGNNRTACFYADEDYSLYLHHLKELSRKVGCAVHAYVLMTNRFGSTWGWIPMERQLKCCAEKLHRQLISCIIIRRGSLYAARWRSHGAGICEIEAQAD